MGRLKEYFDIRRYPPRPTNSARGYEDFLQQTLAEATAPGETVLSWSGLRPQGLAPQAAAGVRQKGAGPADAPGPGPTGCGGLNYLILEKVLGLDAKAQDDQETCKYTSKMSEVVALGRQGGGPLAFMLNPTRIEQVQEVATTSLIMPRKSTYFYPKVMTGLLLNPILPGEEMVLPGETD